jgi:hypothetical protein
MTLQSSGPISFENIRAEYGMGYPVSLSQYYGKPGMQSSGPISLSDFYGKSNITRQPASGEYYSGSFKVYNNNGSIGWSWNGTVVSNIDAGSVTVGAHTYYKGSQRTYATMSVRYSDWAIYRIGPP